MTKRFFIPVITGSIIFTGTYLFLNFPLPHSVIAAAGGYLAGVLLSGTPLLPSLNDRRKKLEIEEILRTTLERLDKLHFLNKTIVKNEVKTALHNVVLTGKGLIADIKKDHSDARRLSSSLTSYLDSIIRIAGMYTMLLEKNIQTPEALRSLEKAEKLLISFEKTIREQRISLATNDILNLDSETEMLKHSLEMEGLKEYES